MSRNITISYLNAFLRHTWFWLGIWVFYYLSITDYAGIGLIETFLIISMTVMEIPTGAIADLLGRKNTLFISFLLQTICQVIMALSYNLPMLLVSVVIGGVGGALCSGTDEALVYDSLKEQGQEKRFLRIKTNLTTINLAAISLSGIVGGWLFLINPTLPFWFSGLGYFIAFILTFFLVEPKIDSIKFSFRNYLEQNKAGFKALFQTSFSRQLVFLIAITCGILIVFDEVLDSVLAVEFGFQPVSISILFAGICLLTAITSQLTPLISRVTGEIKAIVLFTFVVVITTVVSPFAGALIGGLSILLRMVSFTVIENLGANQLNPLIESKYRATTISTLNMINNLPYVFSAYLIGRLMDQITARNFAAIIGIILGCLIIYWVYSYRKSAKNLYNTANV